MVAANAMQVVVHRLTTTSPMTREEDAEIFIYDVAVEPALQRHGIGGVPASVTIFTFDNTSNQCTGSS